VFALHICGMPLIYADLLNFKKISNELNYEENNVTMQNFLKYICQKNVKSILRYWRYFPKIIWKVGIHIQTLHYSNYCFTLQLRYPCIHLSVWKETKGSAWLTECHVFRMGLSRSPLEAKWVNVDSWFWQSIQ